MDSWFGRSSKTKSLKKNKKIEIEDIHIERFYRYGKTDKLYQEQQIISFLVLKKNKKFCKLQKTKRKRYMYQGVVLKNTTNIWKEKW